MIIEYVELGSGCTAQLYGVLCPGHDLIPVGFVNDEIVAEVCLNCLLVINRKRNHVQNNRG